MPLGNAVIGNNGGESEGWRNTKNWFMATVTDDGGNILLVAIMTPPFNITLYETDNLSNDEALECLCENMIKESIAVPGVTSENRLAERFAKTYTKKAGMGYQVHKNMRIYTLDRVDENIPVVGTIRKAEKRIYAFCPIGIALLRSTVIWAAKALTKLLPLLRGRSIVKCFSYWKTPERPFRWPRRCGKS